MTAIDFIEITKGPNREELFEGLEHGYNVNRWHVVTIEGTSLIDHKVSKVEAELRIKTIVDSGEDLEVTAFVSNWWVNDRLMVGLDCPVHIEFRYRPLNQLKDASFSPC